LRLAGGAARGGRRLGLRKGRRRKRKAGQGDNDDKLLVHISS